MANFPRHSAQLAIASASVIIVLYRVVLWRARTRARKSVDRMEDIMQGGGPLIDINDPNVRNNILGRAIRRASTWMTLSERKAQPMIGQLGGASVHKKPVLTLSPGGYVLKPVLWDHRGIREIAFYEAMAIVAKNKPSRVAYANFLKGTTSTAKTPMITWVGEAVDTLAMAFAMIIQDKVVVTSEETLKHLWKVVKREAELLYALGKFTPPYYGVVGQESPSPEYPFGVTDDTHLLLQDITANYSRPCVMDLKMGTTTYEPDASPEKKEREHAKYAGQDAFGFRIVGMRIYDPNHPDAGEFGYRFFNKDFGRSLNDRDQLKQAIKTYFRSGLSTANDKPDLNSVRRDGGADSVKSNGKKARGERIRIKSAANLMVQLRSIQRWFEDNTAFLFCASSLLLVYEGNLASSTPDATTLKMIDFGRVRRNPVVGEGDIGYMHGLRTLRQLLLDIIEEEEDFLEQVKHRRVSSVPTSNLHYL